MAESETQEMFCAMCCYNTTNSREMNNHISRWHKHDPNFSVSCPFKCCEYTSKSWNAYRIHMSRYKLRHDHPDNDSQETSNNNNTEAMDWVNISGDISQDITTSLDRKTCCEIQYVLSLQADCNISNKATDRILEVTTDLVTETQKEILNKVKSALQNANLDTGILDGVDLETPFQNLSTQYLRETMYAKKCRLLNSNEVFLGKRTCSKNGKIQRIKCFGQVIPLKDLLENLLSLPEILHWVDTPCEYRQLPNGIMSDVFDGQYLQEHDLFHKEPKALQIILYNDDIEVVNPIGAHVKKHKISMFYMSLANIPPQFRSKLHTISLIAMAKTADIKTFGLENLLQDFISTVSALATTGIYVNLGNQTRHIFGSLVMVPADTPAANYLGGFKEGVSFAYKGCRKCNASATDMKTQFRHHDFVIRDFETHMQRCETLHPGLLSKECRQYWSKFWGINRRSCLCDLPNSPITEILIQDPMHILLEGLVPIELQLFLFYAIREKKYFSLAYLNSQFVGFPYEYLEHDRLEIITLTDLVAKTRIKQTSGAMLTLCSVLPFMIGDKVPREDEHWQNLLRLLKITHIVTSPFTTLTAIGQLEQIIVTHHTCFKTLYPHASFVPKMHYLVHMPHQMKLFGPGRHQWCMRYEAKHGYFKNLKTKCFKNILKTLCKKHQLYMCSKQMGHLGEPSHNFLYAGDKVGKGDIVNVVEAFAGLTDQLEQTFPSRNWVQNPSAYKCTEIEIHGFKYKCGCFILLVQNENELPVFGLMAQILVVDNDKGFIIDCMETLGYEPHVMSHVVRKTGQKAVVSFSSLLNRWPRISHVFEDDLCIVNSLNHAFES